MSLALVVAVSSNGIIGRNGELPWRLPSDLRRFRELTLGHAVVMGRKTYQSIPARFRPLPGRTNIVLSRTMTPADECLVVESIDEALDRADSDPVFVVGGREIYQLALPRANQIYMTLVEDHIDGDTYFLPLGPEWVESSRSNLMFENDLHFRYLQYDRRLP